MDTLSTLTAEAKQYYVKLMLIVSHRAQVFYQAGLMTDIPRNGGNQVSWRRLESLTPITTALTEGVTPTVTPLSVTEVTATVSEYGAYAEVSDMLDLMGIDPIMARLMERMAQMAGESVESVVSAVIGAGTSVLYATGSTRGAQSASNPLTVAMIRKGVRTLDANNAQRLGGPLQNSKVGQGEYILFVHPNQVYDLQNDSEWKAMQQGSPGYEKLYNGEMDMILGCRIVQSTLVPKFTGAGSGGADVYGAVMVGRDAFGVVDVAGSGKFDVLVKQIGSAGAADPLDQRGTVGWKSPFVSKILNDNFMVRLEAGVSA